MGTLFVIEQHRNRYYSRNKLHVTDDFSSSPSRSFREINCRTFQSGDGILPSPFPVTPVKTPSAITAAIRESNYSICSRTSSVIPISSKLADIENPFSGDSSSTSSYSERWAGPTYSNSPPPSSLPIPKFSLRQKRSISLDSPIPVCGFEVQPVAKSAPPSPSREPASPSTDNVLITTATENLSIHRQRSHHHCNREPAAHSPS